MHAIEAHPCAWQLAYHVVDAGKPGPGKMRIAIRVLDAIAEKAHPDSPWPNPWVTGLTADQRTKVEADTGRTFDLAHRVGVELSVEQVEFLRERLRAYCDGEASVAHGRVLSGLVEALEAVKG